MDRKAQLMAPLEFNSSITCDQLRSLCPRASQRRLSELHPGAAGGSDPSPGEDPVVYEVFEWQTGDGPEEVLAAVTWLYGTGPGEHPRHTRGHFHREPDGPELASCISGRGVLQLLSRSEELRTIDLEAGGSVLVPAGWAHRMVNPNPEPVVFLSTCSAALGHDYGSVPRAEWESGPEPGRVP